MSERIFKVGDRVRVVLAYNNPELVGMVGVVEHIRHMDHHTQSGWSIDGLGGEIPPVGTPCYRTDLSPGYGPASWYEPIPNDDSREAIAWNEAIHDKLLGGVTMRDLCRRKERV